MGLLKRLQAERNGVQADETSVIVSEEKNQKSLLKSESYQQLKEKIHGRLIEKLDLTRLDSIQKNVLRRQVREVVESLVADEADPVIGLNRAHIIEEVMDEVFGLGPLEPLLNDPTVADILVNTHNQVYVERSGKLELTNTIFKDDNHLMNIIDRIVSQVGRRVDESSPMVDARLADGSRGQRYHPATGHRWPHFIHP